MDNSRILIYVFIMAGITYLIRMIPMVVFKKKIKSSFVKSFLFYVPYAVLGAMIFPDVLTSTATLWSAIAGTITAMVLSYKEKGLLMVALSACLTVYVTERILRLCI